ncbi:LPS-assembly protein LptD [Azotobacter beijerinckii]|uniref:LPS-assembly protein LptD n=1 Tax=Azotobacter beijerinckii TaxID=170623 RepID=A0A1I4DFQ9_9GAMM|nr:LPS-assembly protein LptD [Azotobacter beijerinckii]SFB36729.1 LPS-assembly protein [Azotobacter beijerinckii]SFK92514.1 LPS-assembly protein [Azotobacter beijerinckii]
MALTPPRSLFRRKFPLLVTGSLLVLGSARLLAADQFDCQASATGGWNCAPKSAAKPRPPRPHEAAAMAGGQAASAQEAQEGAAATLVTKSEGFALASRSSDYSHLDWVPREKLTPAQLAETGPYCAGAYIEPPRVGMDDKTPMREAPTYVSAKASRYDQDKQVAAIAGDVVLRRGGMQVESDEARLYQLENKGEVSGNVRLRDEGVLVVGDRAEILLDNGEAQVDNAEYVMHRGHVRGSALTAKREETAIIRLKDGTYTTCEPGSNTWTLKGKNIKLDPATGVGNATHVTLRMRDLPVFYTPYIRFPIDDRRQSGFLMPSFGSSSSGLALQTPYYFNLAPNYDATLYPTYMADRGLLMEGEVRYLTKTSEGQVGGGYLDDSDNERKQQSDYQKQRWMYNWQHTGGLNSRLLTEVDYTDISDPYYFQDMQTSLGIRQPDFLNQRGTLTWRGDTFTARLNVQALERSTISDTTPYDRLPQVSLDGFLPYQPQGLHFTYGTEYAKFERSLRRGNFINQSGNPQPWYDENITGLDRADGDRIHLEPGVSLPLEWTWGYLKPSVKVAHTRYDLSLDSKGKQEMAAAGEHYDDSPDRTVPIASLDGSLYFDRNVNWFGKGFRQTLEPRMYYLYVPYRNQKDIPVFDTGEHVFSYASLWRDNRFTGKDRIGDANQLSLGVTSSLIEDNGFERQRVSFGQTIYFKDRRVQMPRVDYKTRDDSKSGVSPYALEYLYRFNHDWRLSSAFNWDPDAHETRSGNAMFHYQPADNPSKIVNLGYRYRKDVMRYNQANGTWDYSTDFGKPGDPNYIKDYYKIKQHDFSTIWPLVPQWSAIARWQYDYSRSRTLDAFGGFEYDSCCWKLRVIERYWIGYNEDNLNPNKNDQADQGIFLQIVFKGLGGVAGSKVDAFLGQGIEGYTEREEYQKAN